MFVRLVIPRTIHDAVIAHARAELPNECCGLLAGAIEDDDGRVTQHFPLRNDSASPTQYLTNARDLLDAVRATRAAGTEFLAVYHSHPSSAAVPSRTDVERNTWGETAVHVIVGLGGDEPDVRAWWLTDVGYRAAELAVQ